MFLNIPQIPLMKYAPIVVPDKESILILNWVGGKECTIRLNLDNYKWNIGNKYCEYELFDFYIAIEYVARAIFKWEDKQTWDLSKKQRGKIDGTKAWMLKRVGGSISKALSKAMRSIIEKYVPADIVFLHKQIISAFGIKEYNHILRRHAINTEFLKTHEFLVKDIKNGYKAALIWLTIEQYGFKDSFSYSNRPESKDWMKFYLPKDEKPYQALTKTFLKCKKIPLKLLNAVGRYFKLPKVFEDSLELKIWTKYALKSSHVSFEYDQHVNPKPNLRNLNCINTLNRPQILRARKLLETHLREKLDFRKRIDIDRFVSFLYDYPTQENCEIVTLMERSIQWHIAERQKNLERARKEAELNIAKVVAKPPIPLPKGPIFLDNANAILIEGNAMGHCVGSYVREAVIGNCYLFHIDWKGHKATAEVSREGRLVQIHGPYNRDKDNKAVVYGKNILTKWAKELREFVEKEKIGGKTDKCTDKYGIIQGPTERFRLDELVGDLDEAEPEFTIPF